MMMVSALANAVHALAAIVWVGGMFFAHMALRPALAPVPGADRLALWSRILPRFFAWVWGSVIALLVTGYGALMSDFGGFAYAPVHIHLMQALGLPMMALYAWLYAMPYRRFRAAVAAGDWDRAARHQAAIRRVVATNLVLGLVTSAVGASGRFWA